MESDHSGRTVSVWMATQELPIWGPLENDIAADVCVVGAGIAGLTTAYLLGREGRKVVVVDDGPVLSGETERTTAHLASALDDRFFELEKLFGQEGARLAGQSHAAAIDTIEEIAAREHIDCDFARLDGYLFLGPGDAEQLLDRELAAARRAGLNVEKVARAPLASFDTGPALRFGRQGQFHPSKYLAGVAQAIIRQAGKIFTHTQAFGISGGTRPVVEMTSGKHVRAGAVVVATNTPVNDRVTMHTKQAPYRTYAIGARVPVGAVPVALYWDTLDPYHYVRLQSVTDRTTGAESPLLIVGGEDHKTGQATDLQERFARLETWTRERFPIGAVEYRWSGQVMEPTDGLGFIGRNPGAEENVYIATGDSGHGMTHGTLAGMILMDLIAGRRNPWADLYNPARKNLALSSMADFARENLNVVAQYADFVRPGDVRDAAAIPNDSGAVMTRRGKKIAVYRHADGRLQEFSAVCPHLGCVVSWNGVEKTWDCPCHGSRFSCDGQVVNGPSLTGLPKADEAAASARTEAA